MCERLARSASRLSVIPFDQVYHGPNRLPAQGRRLGGSIAIRKLSAVSLEAQLEVISSNFGLLGSDRTNHIGLPHSAQGIPLLENEHTSVWSGDRRIIWCPHSLEVPTCRLCTGVSLDRAAQKIRLRPGATLGRREKAAAGLRSATALTPYA